MPRCATQSEWEALQSTGTLRKVVLGKMLWWTKRNDNRLRKKNMRRLLIRSSATNRTVTVSALRDAT